MSMEPELKRLRDAVRDLGYEFNDKIEELGKLSDSLQKIRVEINKIIKENFNAT